MTDLASATRAIDHALPDMARDVIRTYLDLDDPANRAFLRNPDGRDQHQTHWHEWGIITHTRVFLRHFDREVPGYLRAWGLWEPVHRVLEGCIDGSSRWNLLRISILLHDLGKFASRTGGRSTFHFMHHETLSGRVIRHQLALERFGLAPAQIEYVAHSAEDHFVLGLIRKRAREEGKFDLAFTRSERFGTLAGGIKQTHPEDFVEIGVLFLGDSLAKTDPEGGPRDGRPEWWPAVSQYEINIAVAQRYLEVVLQSPSL